MSLIPLAVIFASALGGQQAPAKIQYRDVKVNAAGIQMSVPKVWAQSRKDSNVVASFKIPVSGTKSFARLDVGYVLDGSSDADGFLSAQKDLLTQQGIKVESQRKSEILGASFAFTTYQKDTEKISRGVLFRSTQAKLTLLLAASPEHFEKVEPELLKVMETIKDVPIQLPKTQVAAVEKNYQLSPEGFPISPKYQQKQLVTLNGEFFELLLPRAAKISKLGETSFSVLLPKIPGTTIVNCHPITNQSTSELLVNKVNESLSLFEGSVKRTDNFRRMTLGESQRFVIMREGLNVKDSKPLMTIDAILVGVDGGVVHLFYVSSNPKTFKSEMKELLANLEITRIFLKK